MDNISSVRAGRHRFSSLCLPIETLTKYIQQRDNHSYTGKLLPGDIAEALPVKSPHERINITRRRSTGNEQNRKQYDDKKDSYCSPDFAHRIGYPRQPVSLIRCYSNYKHTNILGEKGKLKVQRSKAPANWKPYPHNEGNSTQGKSK